MRPMAQADGQRRRQDVGQFKSGDALFAEDEEIGGDVA